MDDTTSATSIWKTMEGAGRNLGMNLLAYCDHVEGGRHNAKAAELFMASPIRAKAAFLRANRAGERGTMGMQSLSLFRSPSHRSFETFFAEKEQFP